MDTRPGQGANKRTADGGRACEGLRVTLSGTGTGQDRIRISPKRGRWRVCEARQLVMIVRQRSRPAQGLGLKEADSECGMW